MNPPITPGEILLEEYLAPRGISQNAMARSIGVPTRAINEIVLGHRAITPVMSIRFGGLSSARFPSFGTPCTAPYFADFTACVSRSNSAASWLCGSTFNALRARSMAFKASGIFFSCTRCSANPATTSSKNPMPAPRP